MPEPNELFSAGTRPLDLCEVSKQRNHKKDAAKLKDLTAARQVTTDLETLNENRH